MLGFTAPNLKKNHPNKLKKTKKTGKEKKANQTGLKSDSEQEGGSLPPPTFIGAQGFVSTASPSKPKLLVLPIIPGNGEAGVAV